MFTGIIEETGTIKNIIKGASSFELTISAKEIFSDLRLGDSVAVNGVCLTAKSISSNAFTADVMHETLNRSSLKILKNGSHVNLERAMAANGRFGGHIVSGHIDGTGTISKIEKDGIAVWYTIKAESTVMKYIIEKGSVAIDGISLTVAKVTKNDFSVSVIPHTMANTVLPEKTVGDIVNLENDCIGKYVEKLMTNETESKTQKGITRDFLAKYGY